MICGRRTNDVGLMTTFPKFKMATLFLDKLLFMSNYLHREVEPKIDSASS
jgi:hypothetical protein